MPQGRAIAISAAALGVLAAIFDVIENLGILRVVNADLAHTTQSMIDQPSAIRASLSGRSPRSRWACWRSFSCA